MAAGSVSAGGFVLGNMHFVGVGSGDDAQLAVSATWGVGAMTTTSFILRLTLDEAVDLRDGINQWLRGQGGHEHDREATRPSS